MDSRGAVQSIHLQARIVGNYQTWQFSRYSENFENRVLLKSASSLRNVGNLRMRSQIIYFELRPENSLYFFRLMRIARCQQKLDHDSNEIWKPGIQD